MKFSSNHSLFRKIMIPLFVILVAQGFIYYAGTMHGGVSQVLTENSESVLEEKVASQMSTIETRFATQWTNVDIPANNITALYNKTQEEQDVPIYADEELEKTFLADSVPTLVSMLRNNGVSGVFLILNGQADYQPLEGVQSRYGLCIRDYTPDGAYSGTEDLQIVRGPSGILKSSGITLETWWESMYTFNDQLPGDYFYKPLEMAYRYPDSSIDNLSYFDPTHNFGNTDRTVVSWSLPLRDDTGYPFAVLGIELTNEYLKSQIQNSGFYGENNSAVALVSFEDGNDQLKILANNGSLTQQAFGNNTTIQITPKEDSIFTASGTLQKVNLTGSLQTIKIYNHNTPYENQRLALIGLVRDSSLYSLNKTIQRQLMLLSVVVVLIGILAAFIISYQITDPVLKLSKKIQHADTESMPELERVNIDEIDNLVSSIEDLSTKVTQNKVRAEFFSRMSHDMRTPMNAIIGFSSPEMVDDAQEAKLRECLQKIHTSGDYLLTLINEILDMTKIESERMELRSEALNEQVLLMEVAPIIEEVAKEKKVHFTKEIDSSDLAFIGDRQRLSQILMNLLSNAVKFTPENGTVTLKLKATAPDSEHVVLDMAVIDTGEGMSEEFQTKMYEPFSQEGRREGGTGLGLAIAKQLVTLMGGTITCTSELGKGSDFRIHLECKAADPADVEVQETEATKPEENDTVNLTGQRILLCEDHPLNAQIARALLERRGMIVEHAENGKIGLEMFMKSPQSYYNLILMDIRMPEMDGLETTKAIRALSRPDAKTIPIVAMTANAFKEDVEMSHEVGMNEHLSKPIDPSILYITLEKYLG